MIFDLTIHMMGLPGGSDGKESACHVGDLGSIPGLGTSPGEGYGNHSSILVWGISMDRGAWRGTELDLTEQLSTAHAYYGQCFWLSYVAPGEPVLMYWHSLKCPF